MACNGGDEIVSQSDLTQHGRKQRPVDAIEVPHEIGFDLVTHGSHGAACKQRLGGGPQRRLEEVDRGRAAERLVEPLAEADPRGRGVADCGSQ